MSANANEIAGLRRRYLWMTVSICVLDIAISVIFRLVNGGWQTLWISVAPSVALLLGANWWLAHRLFERIDRFLKGAIAFEAIERRLTQLPLLTAQWVAIFAFVLYAWRNSLSWWMPGPEAAVGLQTGVDVRADLLQLHGVTFRRRTCGRGRERDRGSG